MIVLGGLGMAPDGERNKWENLKLEYHRDKSQGLIPGRLMPNKSPGSQMGTPQCTGEASHAKQAGVEKTPRFYF